MQVSLLTYWIERLLEKIADLTRSILADNSPYFESGVKLSYTSAMLSGFVSG